MVTPDLIRRQDAMRATMARYRRRDFDWKGSNNCGGLFRFHARKMGHRLPKWPAYASALGMVRALRSLGHANCIELLDAIPSLERIAPAAMLMGDVCVVAGGAPESEAETAPAMAEVGAIALCLGPHKIIGWRADAGPRMVVLDVGFDVIQAAWRL